MCYLESNVALHQANTTSIIRPIRLSGRALGQRGLDNRGSTVHVHIQSVLHVHVHCSVKLSILHTHPMPMCVG